MPQRLIVSTRNQHKITEIRALLPDWEVLDLSLIEEAPEVEETGVTFLENAGLKALAISSLTDDLVLADDSGLEVDVLAGEPGVYSSRYAGEGATDAQNNEKLLRALGDVEVEGRTARFRCVIVLAKGGEILAHFSSSVEGRIATTPSGSGGFGYDPLFVPDGYNQSFAELGEEVKNQFSHRARAMEQVQRYLSDEEA